MRLDPRPRIRVGQVSGETAEARNVARQAERAWKEHLAGCPKCEISVRSRQPDLKCRDGQALYGIRTDANRELARNRDLDKQPAPGQEMLFR